MLSHARGMTNSMNSHSGPEMPTRQLSRRRHLTVTGHSQFLYDDTLPPSESFRKVSRTVAARLML